VIRTLIGVDLGMVFGAVAVFGAGLLAGEELLIRYGVRGPLASIDDESHIRLRKALVLRLRVLVPAMYLLTLLSAGVAAIASGRGDALVLRGAALLALLVWIGVTLGGTAKINAAVLDWSPTVPPEDWREQVDRWERLNTVRTWLAVVAFALLVVALA
jgi:uncharacterized membrane protein